MKVAVLVSGQGSNLKALLEAIDAGRCAAQLCGVLSDREKAPALELARARGLPTRVVRPKQFEDRAAWDAALAEAIAALEPQLVVLAGFMRILGSQVLGRFPGRVINVHPALLPAFRGLDAPAQAVDAGAKISGCTVHVVDDGVDTGPTLAQAAVAVLPGDDAATLHARIQRAEHELLPAVVHAIAQGELELGAAPRYLPAAADAPPPLVWPPVL